MEEEEDLPCPLVTERIEPATMSREYDEQSPVRSEIAQILEKIGVAQTRSQPPPQVKRHLKKVVAEKREGTEGFLASFLETQQRRDGNNFLQEFINLDQELWGEPNEVSKILLRQWYIDMAPPLIKNFDPLQTGGEPSLCTYIVAGNKGTGKSVFGLYLLQQSLNVGLIVAYRNANQRFWVVGSETGERDLSPVKAVFNHLEYEPALTPGVYECNGSDELLMFDKLTRRPHVIYIVDAGDIFFGELAPTGQKVVISSPNNDILKRIGEIANPLYIYMPLWSPSELQALNRTLPQAKDKPAALYVSQTDDDLEYLMEIFGGVPHWIFANQPVARKVNTIDDVIGETSFEVWQRVFGLGNYSRLPKCTPGMLVQIQPCQNSSNQSFVEFNFISPQIAAMVTRHFFQRKRQKLVRFLNALDQDNKMASSMRIFFEEERMHSVFTQRQGVGARCFEVAKMGAEGKFRTFKLPDLHLKTFYLMSMKDFTSIGMNDYHYPMIVNFPAVNAIALMDKSAFLDDPKEVL